MRDGVLRGQAQSIRPKGLPSTDAVTVETILIGRNRNAISASIGWASQAGGEIRGTPALGISLFGGCSVRFRVRFVALCAIAFAGPLVGCSAGASSATHEGLVPSSTQQGSVLGIGSPSAKRRPSSSNCGSALDSFVGGGTGNTATAVAAGILAGANNDICGATGAAVGGGDYNSISSSPSASEFAFIGGGYYNSISGSNAGNAFVGAGDYNTVTGYSASILGGEGNSASAEGTSIGGGQNNVNAATYSFIGAGNGNSLMSAATYGVVGAGSNNALSAEYGVIGGGLHNSVSGEGGYIAAGGYNTVTGTGAVIDGGFNNAAAGSYGTVPGGYVNSAGGIYSFAAGARASAGQTGTFVWSDGSDGDAILASSRAYQFLARASGGFTLWTNAASTVGATLAPGSGTWASASDRNMKTDVVGVDDAAVLDKVASLPINRWSYVTERGVRHVGPMAQDFYAAFGVGEDDKHITSIDEDGVALGAIKALHAETGELRTHVNALGSENALLRRRLAAVTAAEAQHDAHDRRVDVELSELEARSHR